MSDPQYPAAPQKVRPASVTISSYLLYLVAALQVVGLVLAISMLGPTMEVYEEGFAGTPMAEQAGLFATVGLVVGVGFGVLLAVGLVVLAVLNNRGKNAARIVTWVVGGLFLCCLGGGLTISATGNALDFGSGGANGPDQAEIERLLEDRLPSWYMPADLTLDVLAFLALLAALILLALPASNEFFRRPQTVWEPPVPGSTYPAYPGSGYPGYPPAGPGYPPAGPSGPPPPPGDGR